VEQQIEALRQLVEGQEAEIRQRAEAMAQLNARLDTLIAAQEGQARAAELEAASA
jgi:ATP-dependent protease ClpP protease subunit